MGWRFRRTWSVIPGVRLNLGLKSGSVSFGVRGLHYTVGTTGSRITAGLPGTGLFWTKKLNSLSASAHSGPWNQTQPPLPRVGGVGQAAQPFPQPAPVGAQTQISARVVGAAPTPTSPPPTGGGPHFQLRQPRTFLSSSGPQYATFNAPRSTAPSVGSGKPLSVIYTHLVVPVWLFWSVITVIVIAGLCMGSAMMSDLLR